MLDLINVGKSYANQVVAVQDVSLTLTSGVIGLVGHNGAGKSSLMQMIATLVRPSCGHVLYRGRDIVSDPQAIRPFLGYLPQDAGSYPNLTAVEFLQYFAALKGVRDKRRLAQVLSLVNLQGLGERLTSTFSGGMRRRLGIAQALLNDPDILIVDEPTAGLDLEERQRFRRLLSEVAARKLVIVSTHIVSDIEDVADQVAVMRQGRMVSYGSTAMHVENARGLVWSAIVPLKDYEALSPSLHVVSARSDPAGVALRVIGREVPCRGAALAVPSLDEALMVERYLSQGDGK